MPATPNWIVITPWPHRLRVSPLALGTMTFGTEWGWDRQGNRPPDGERLRRGRRNFFDTADLYTNGTSEAWLGEFIAERTCATRR